VNETVHRATAHEAGAGYITWRGFSSMGEEDAAFAPDVSGRSISVTRSRCAVVSTRAGSLLWSYP